MKQYNLHNNFLLLILDRMSDKELIIKHANDIFDILHDAYQNIGSCSIYHNVRHMIKSVYRYKIILHNNEIYAAATYNYITAKQSYKCTLIGGNIHRQDAALIRKAVKYIIKLDIINFKHLYWIEASGPIAHWEEKYGAYKIPNVYVESILNKAVEKGSDGYTYTRDIPGIDDPIEKTMFGFDSVGTLQKLMSDNDITEYEKTLAKLYSGQGLNGLFESVYLNNRIKQLLRLIDFIIQEYEEANQFYNVSPVIFSIIDRLIKECTLLLNRGDEINDIDPFIFRDKLDYIQEIYNNANIIIPRKLF